MKFKVYNGPLPLPICQYRGWEWVDQSVLKAKEVKCEKEICDWLSDKNCEKHALEYVQHWDRKGYAATESY